MGLEFIKVHTKYPIIFKVVGRIKYSDLQRLINLIRHLHTPVENVPH